MTNDVDLDDERKSSQIVDYLQAPRKKRKNYIIMALGRAFDPDVAAGIELYIRQSVTQYALSQPKSEKELMRLFSRQIVALILDDHFAGPEYTMELVKSLKIKKKENPVPVIFLTENPSGLIEDYNKTLLAYQESDNYIQYRALSIQQICSRIHSSLNVGSARRSRRFKTDIPVQYFHLTKSQFFAGEVLEMSVHGAVLRSTQGEIFRFNDQLKLQLPTLRLLPPDYGEFLHLAAKVRRVFMGGDKVGISWEYLSESQSLILTRYVTELANGQMMRSFNLAKRERPPAAT